MLRFRFFWLAFVFFLSGCFTINVGPSYHNKLREYVVVGGGADKIALIDLIGPIGTESRMAGFSSQPSVVSDLLSRLDLVRQDPQVRGVVLRIDSPGGTVTASEILYHKLKNFQKETGIKVVAFVVNVAASGGYYAAVATENIIAHHAAIVGSVGAIFMQPNITGLGEKVGFHMRVYKSGKHKDMLSMFRDPSEEEKVIGQNMVDKMGKRFFSLVAKERRITDPKAKEAVATARIFIADEALSYGLVDSLGFVDDAVKKSAAFAGVHEKPTVIAYRRGAIANDHLYHFLAKKTGTAWKDTVSEFSKSFLLHPGFYYLEPSLVPLMSY